MRNADTVWDLVEDHREAFIALSDRVFDTPETLYAEVLSCAAHAEMLEAQGFRITRAPAGIPTAVIGEAGEGGPVIAILGEYDALPGLSQEPGVAEHRPLVAGGNGHGCGHNLLGSAALLAATAVKDWLAANGIAARVRYYGCPAEEGGAAKTYMVRAGLFSDVDAAITWHPASFTGVDQPSALANTRIDFTFIGRAAHAAGAPELGRSALDAVELMNVGVNYMREHMPDDARIHYAYMDAGGQAPNVVQARATVRQLIRARDLAGLRALVARVRKVAEGAALMTETEVTARVFSGVSNIVGNTPLEQAMQRAFDALGPVPFDDADRDFARAIRATFTQDDIAATFRRIGMEPDFDLPLCDFVAPLDRRGAGGDGSTDVGDVSWAVPTVQARVATCAIGTPFHTWQLTAQGKSAMAHKGMVHAAKIMAATARILIEEPATREAATAAHARHLARTPYSCPIPDDVHPPIPREAA
ncbi:MAG: amidohydrolase [Alkalilacustris sp.]